MSSILVILSRRIDEIIYDPYAILHKLDDISAGMIDKRDPSIPNLDIVLRRRIFLKSMQLTNLFLCVEKIYKDGVDYVYPSNNVIHILQKISNLFMYQIEPELNDLKFKYQPRSQAEIDYYEDSEISSKIDNNIIFNFHPEFDEEYPENAIPRPESLGVRSSLYSQIVSTHRNISNIHLNSILPFIYLLKSIRRKIKYIIKEDIKCFQRIPDIIIEKILNEYM